MKVWKILLGGCIAGCLFVGNVYSQPQDYFGPGWELKKDIGKDGQSFRRAHLGDQMIFEGSTSDGSETSLVITNPTRDNTITVPDASGSMSVWHAATHTFAISVGTWTLSTAEAQATFFGCSVGSTTYNYKVVFPRMPGHRFVIYNDSAGSITARVGATGSGTTCQPNTFTDCIIKATGPASASVDVQKIGSIAE